jgi:hypothetical protein
MCVCAFTYIEVNAWLLFCVLLIAAASICHPSQPVAWICYAYIMCMCIHVRTEQMYCQGPRTGTVCVLLLKAIHNYLCVRIYAFEIPGAIPAPNVHWTHSTQQIGIPAAGGGPALLAAACGFLTLVWPTTSTRLNVAACCGCCTTLVPPADSEGAKPGGLRRACPGCVLARGSVPGLTVNVPALVCSWWVLQWYWVCTAR